MTDPTTFDDLPDPGPDPGCAHGLPRSRCGPCELTYYDSHRLRWRGVLCEGRGDVETAGLFARAADALARLHGAEVIEDMLDQESQESHDEGSTRSSAPYARRHTGPRAPRALRDTPTCAIAAGDEYVGPEQLRKRLGLANSSLYRWRTTGEGPPFSKIGRRVVYRWSDVVAWFEALRRGKAVRP